MTTLTPAIEVPRGKRGRPQLRVNHDAIILWSERVVTTLDDVDYADRARDHNSIILANDKLYHYGHHFCLAEIIRKPNGRARMVLFNGDRYTGPSGWGNSTWSVQLSVQRVVREQIEESGAKIETVTIPFSALEAAGIDQTSVRPLHVEDDRTEYTDFSSRERPGELRKMDDPTGATYCHTEQRTGYVHNDTGEVFKAHAIEGGGWLHNPEDRENWSWKGYAHVEDRPCKVPDPNRSDVEVKTAGWSHEGAKLGDDGLWRWTVETHKLGEALFTARYTSVSFRPATAAEVEAYEDFEAWQREHRNAGYPDLDKLDSYGVRERPEQPDVEMTNRSRVSTPNWHVRVTKSRVEKFLSSYDYAEPHRPYFMCELPHACPARTIPEALEALKPADVAQCIDAGLDVLRQGDIFAIPTDATEDELVAQAVTTERTFYRSLNEAPWSVAAEETVAIRKIGQDGYRPRAKDIHGSTHQVTHLIVTKDGRMFGRGRMYHRPSGWGRTAEHRTLDLGDRKTWYRLVRNTVPTDTQGNIRSAGGIQQSGNARAWMLGGMVD